MHACECDSPTDAISDCLNVDRVSKRFVVTSFFLVAAELLYTLDDSGFFGVFGVTAVNISLSVSKNCANIIG